MILESECAFVLNVLNFFTAYLRLAKVVREKLCVATILGLTATAPDATLSDCAVRLGVCPETGIVRGPFMPDNLTLSVSRDRNREKALLDLLKTEPFASFDSVIIYCTRLDFFLILGLISQDFWWPGIPLSVPTI